MKLDKDEFLFILVMLIPVALAITIVLWCGIIKLLGN